MLASVIKLRASWQLTPFVTCVLCVGPIMSRISRCYRGPRSIALPAGNPYGTE